MNIKITKDQLLLNGVGQICWSNDIDFPLATNFQATLAIIASGFAMDYAS